MRAIKVSEGRSCLCTRQDGQRGCKGQKRSFCNKIPTLILLFVNMAVSDIKKKMLSRNINREMRSRSRMRCPLCVYPKIKTLLHKEKQQSLQNVTWEVEEVRAFLSGIVFVWHTHKWDLTDIVQGRFTLQVPASEGSLPGQTDKPVERGP